jgi:hypothetical protein
LHYPLTYTHALDTQTRAPAIHTHAPEDEPMAEHVDRRVCVQGCRHAERSVCKDVAEVDEKVGATSLDRAQKEHPAHYLCIDGHGREVPEQVHGDVAVITAAYSGRGVGGGNKRGREGSRDEGDRNSELTKRLCDRNGCLAHSLASCVLSSHSLLAFVEPTTWTVKRVSGACMCKKHVCVSMCVSRTACV